MSKSIEIENIEEMRRQEGIDDVELRQEIRALGRGDFVKVTFLSGEKSFETMLVRITSVRGDKFRGKLAGKPACIGLSELHEGSPITFTTAHIHSLAKENNRE